MTLDKTMRATIRAWGLANRIPGCHPKGILSQSVIDAYWEAHPDQATAIADAQAPPDTTEPETEPESVFTVAVDLYDHENGTQVAEHLVNALYATWTAGYEAGKAQTRAELLAVLDGDGA